MDHRAFHDLDVDLAASLVSGKRLLDARNALDRTTWESRGFEVNVLGAAFAEFGEPDSEPPRSDAVALPARITLLWMRVRSA